MLRLFPLALAALAVIVQPGQQLSAQLWEAGLPGDDVGSIALQFGQVMPQSEMTDGAKYESGSGFGASLNYWPFARLGVRTTVFRAKTQGMHGSDFASPVGFQEPVVWLYTLEPAVRLPFQGGSIAGAPYLSAGIGGKSYRWSLDRPRVGNSQFAITGAAGLDLRAAGSPQYGLVIEARFHRTEYPYHGYQIDSPVQNDIVITAGLSVNR